MYNQGEVKRTTLKRMKQSKREEGAKYEITAHEWWDIVEWQSEKLWEKYNKNREVGLQTYNNGNWRLKTKQWQYRMERRIDMRDILIQGNYRRTITNELALLREV